jgi:hypothetical protein
VSKRAKGRGVPDRFRRTATIAVELHSIKRHSPAGLAGRSRFSLPLSHVCLAQAKSF